MKLKCTRKPGFFCLDQLVSLCAGTGEHLASEAEKTFDDIIGAESGTTDSIILRMKRILKVVKIKAEATYQN